MSTGGELRLGDRRPSTPGSNGQVLFNNNGVDGASPNCTFSYTTNTLTTNGISFVPVWTSLTTNNAGANPNGPNNWTGVQVGWDTAAYWKDPFGQVHLRGLLANSGAGNTSLNNLQTGQNIANGLPHPTTNVFMYMPCGGAGNGVGNVFTIILTLYGNGAIQIVNIGLGACSGGGKGAASWNVGNISLYNFHYSVY